MAEETEKDPKWVIDPEAERIKPRLLALLFSDWGAHTLDRKAAVGGIFDRLFVSGREGEPAVFFLYLRATEVHPQGIRLRVFSPAGEEIAGMTSLGNEEFVPSESEPNYYELLTRVGLEFSSPGVHWFDVSHRGQSLGRVPLIVDFKEDGDGSDDEK